MQEQIRKAQEERDKNKEMLLKEKEELEKLIRQKEEQKGKELEELRMKAESA
jgi:hypothetical protein